MLDYFQYLKQHSLFKYVKLPSRAKQLQENDFTLLLVLHTYYVSVKEKHPPLYHKKRRVK